MSEWNDSRDDVVARCELDPAADAPAIELVGLVADLEEADPMELPPLYERIDDLIDALFSSPPATAAGAELEFSYEGYRIRLQQNGTATVRQAPA